MGANCEDGPPVPVHCSVERATDLNGAVAWKSWKLLWNGWEGVPEGWSLVKAWRRSQSRKLVRQRKKCNLPCLEICSSLIYSYPSCCHRVNTSYCTFHPGCEKVQTD